MATTPTSDAIGFIGLGAPIAANLLVAGRALSVWNRSPEKAEPLPERGARIATSVGDAITLGGVVFTIHWDDSSLEGAAGAGLRPR